MKHARHVPAGQGMRIELGERPTVYVHQDWVGGHYVAFEHPVTPRSLGMPHVHANEDQVSFVLEGTLGFYIGGDELVATKGSAVLRPRGVPHALWNPTDQPARQLEISSPGGIENYFSELQDLVQAAAAPEQISAVQGKWGITGLPDLIAQLEERHHVRLRA